MRIAIFGTGEVGRALAQKLHSVGHDVVIGSGDVAITMARTEPSRKGTPPYAVWQAENPEIRLLSYADAAAHGDLVVNAITADKVTAGLASAAADLEGKVLIDISLPLDFSQGMPPRLTVVNDDSWSEQLQRAHPAAQVVKTLSTVDHQTMVNPARLSGAHNIFVSGNDGAAKETTKRFLADLGWPATAIIDLGDLTTARAVEMYSRLLFTLAEVFGDYNFNIAIVR